MKWIKRLCILFLLLVSVSVYCGFSQDELFSDQLWKLQKQYEQKLSQLNHLVMMSQKDIIEWNEQLPDLLNEARQLKLDLQALSLEAMNLLKEAKFLKEDLQILVDQLERAKKDMDSLLESLENSEILLKLLEKQLNAQIWKTNIGLGISITSALIAVGTLLYNLFGRKE